MHPDGGSQLFVANKELGAMIPNGNKKSIFESGTRKGMSWCFMKLAEAPWVNGCNVFN